MHKIGLWLVCLAGIGGCSADPGTLYGNQGWRADGLCATPDEDGEVHEGCLCAPGSSAACYTGPAGTEGIGSCHGGTKACNDAGTAFGDCAGQVLPEAETCNAPSDPAADEDCDGQVNEGVCPVVAVAVGGAHSLALRSDGSVLAWGWNKWGQLGDGTSTPSFVPMEIPFLRGIAIAAGRFHSMALRADGSVWAWGNNAAGQLGIGTFSHQGYPVAVSNLDHITAIAASETHAMALHSGGTVLGWGNNDRGQLGTGTADSGSSTPVMVPHLSDIQAITANFAQSLAIADNGTGWAWGFNGYGQLGDGTTVDRAAPVPIAHLTNLTGIAAGDTHSLALQSDGTVWAWGFNGAGQLGDGTLVAKATPVEVPGLGHILAIAAGGAHSLALQSDGTVRAWGSNDDGELGDGTTVPSSVAVAVSNLTSIVGIATGASHSLAVGADGTVWSWGKNESGELGDGTTTARHVPVRVPIP